MVKGCLKVSILFKTDILSKGFAPIMSNWLSRTIPMSKYFSGSRPLWHNEVQLYKETRPKHVVNKPLVLCSLVFPTCRLCMWCKKPASPSRLGSRFTTAACSGPTGSESRYCRLTRGGSTRRHSCPTSPTWWTSPSTTTTGPMVGCLGNWVETCLVTSITCYVSYIAHVWFSSVITCKYLYIMLSS